VKAFAVNRLVACLGLLASSRFAPWQRLCALTTLGSFVWSCVLSAPCVAFAQTRGNTPNIIANNKNP